MLPLFRDGLSFLDVATWPAPSEAGAAVYDFDFPFVVSDCAAVRAFKEGAPFCSTLATFSSQFPQAKETKAKCKYTTHLLPSHGEDLAKKVCTAFMPAEKSLIRLDSNRAVDIIWLNGYTTAYQQ
eukprot:9024171-Alexandrium_andersonii.AAC.1